MRRVLLAAPAAAVLALAAFRARPAPEAGTPVQLRSAAPGREVAFAVRGAGSDARLEAPAVERRAGAVWARTPATVVLTRGTAVLGAAPGGPALIAEVVTAARGARWRVRARGAEVTLTARPGRAPTLEAATIGAERVP